MSISSDAVRAGQAVYSSRTLSWYDFLVLGISARWIWKCPSPITRALYEECLSERHLEVGVGTGYFLDRCRFPVPDPQITLVDLNQNCLDATAQRIARYHPETLVRNALEPLNLGDRKFQSAAINYVLHCLPGSMEEKGVVFDHLRDVLSPGGTIFGSTILSQGVATSPLAKRLMRAYNRKRIFCNENDSLAALEATLSRRFERWEVRTVGTVALFKVRVT
jgi:ubiquinone/menaquinone biosynthesis C-methylase UbiE